MMDSALRYVGARRVVVALAAVLSTLCVSCATPLLSEGLADTTGDTAGDTTTPAPGDAAAGDAAVGDPGVGDPEGGCSTPEGSARFAAAGAADVGMDRDRLQRAVAYATARGAQSVRIYRHGCLVARSGNDPVTEGMRLPGWSMTKGVVSTVLGRAVAMGLVSVADPISTYLDGLDEAHGALTVEHFLTQTSGLRMAWANDLWAAASTDSVADVLQRPFEARPGSTFLYAQTAVTVLVAVLEAASGEDFQDFARVELFEPLGIPRHQWSWARDASGRTQGFAFLDMAPVAWARLGHLLLRDGVWGGRRLIDSAYIAAGRRGTTANAGYGYLWRTNAGDWNIDSGIPDYQVSDEPNWPGLPRDTFAYSGLFDQDMVVIPSLDMVVVRLGLPPELFGDPMGESPGIRPSYEWRFNRLLMASVTDVEVADPGPWVYEHDLRAVEVSNLIEPTLPPFRTELPGWLARAVGL